jgi:hypothetical protein
MTEIATTISKQQGSKLNPVTLTLGEKYTFKNTASTVLVVEHYNAAVPAGGAGIHIVTPEKAASYLDIEDPDYVIAPGEARVFGALPSTTFSPVVEFMALGADVAAGLLKAYVLEVRSYG